MEFSNSVSTILILSSLLWITKCAGNMEYSDYCPSFNKTTYQFEKPRKFPVFGTVEVDPFEVEDRRALHKIYLLIASITRGVLDNNLVNHVDTYLHKFYEKYQVKYIPDVTTGSQVLAVMQQISEDRSLSKADQARIRKSMYLAAGYMADWRERFEQYNTEERENEKPKRDYFLFVVGILRIIFNQRKGYIMFDPESNTVFPEIIMEDGQAPYLDYLGNKKGKIRFVDQILQGIQNIRPRIIYVGHPYCSFLDTTEKYRAHCIYKEVNPYYGWRRELSKRDMDGHILGGIVAMESQNEYNNILELYLNNNTTEPFTKGDSVELDIELMASGEISEQDTSMNLVENIKDLFEWETFDVIAKLKDIAIALNDEVFYNQFCDIKKPKSKITNWF